MHGFPTIERPAMTSSELEAFLVEHFPDAAGRYSVQHVTPVGIDVVLANDASHVRPGGTVSGPTLMTLADVAAWLATVSRIGPVAASVTSSLSIDFLRRPQLTDLYAHAELLKLGRRQSVCDVRMHSGVEGPLVARATVTYAIP